MVAILRHEARGIDFPITERVDFQACSILFFSNRFGSRNLVSYDEGEAGENPALPRNCKRGNCSRSLGVPGKAGCGCRMAIAILTR
jgi:hypothetical protein